MFFTEEEKTKVFTVHKTVMSMLRDRGYVVEDAEITLTRADFITKFGDHVTRENLEMQKEMHNDSSNKIMIFYPNDSKIGVKNIRGCLDRMKAEDITRGILILQKKLAPQARACIAAASSLYLIDVFEPEGIILQSNDNSKIQESLGWSNKVGKHDPTVSLHLLIHAMVEEKRMAQVLKLKIQNAMMYWEGRGIRKKMKLQIKDVSYHPP
ncbi:unnamed protein product [Cuscuta europaea]|uniref:RNA polymerase Rpb5 N-terminal domain-containing protein n=1 Tax=Cuscuta europaea TaxID=41803 RepID=A0A9P0ZYW1_CUSEU|nr:unnamed protein product [Cuscuta europaea]